MQLNLVRGTNAAGPVKKIDIFGGRATAAELSATNIDSHMFASILCA